MLYVITHTQNQLLSWHSWMWLLTLIISSRITSVLVSQKHQLTSSHLFDGFPWHTHTVHCCPSSLTQQSHLTLMFPIFDWSREIIAVFPDWGGWGFDVNAVCVRQQNTHIHVRSQSVWRRGKACVNYPGLNSPWSSGVLGRSSPDHRLSFPCVVIST